MREPTIRVVAVHRSSALDVGLIAMGATLGWLFAAYSQSKKTMPPALESRPLSSTWKNDALWGNQAEVALKTLQAFDDVTVGATLEDIRALQSKTDTSAQDAHEYAFNQYNQTEDIRYSQRADTINNKANAFDQYLAAKSLSLIHGDITALKSQSDHLEAVGKEIPDASDHIAKIDSFLSVFDQLINLVK